MYIVGIDIAKRFHEAAIIDQVGKVIVKRIRFANSHAGFLKLMDAVRKLDLYAGLYPKSRQSGEVKLMGECISAALLILGELFGLPPLLPLLKPPLSAFFTKRNAPKVKTI